MAKTSKMIVLSLCAAVVLSGCAGTAIREGIGAVKGAEGVYTETQPASTPPGDRSTLAGYTNYELEPLRDDFAGKVPAGFGSNLAVQFPMQLAKKDIVSRPGGKTLVIRGSVIYFELRENALGFALGDIEEVVARLELLDKATGRQIAAGICVGRTKDRINFGVEKKAEGLAKAIAEWIAAYSPEPGV